MIRPTDLHFSKYNALLNNLRNMHSAAVAFSGGVDSELLLYATHEALSDRVMAVTAVSVLFPASDLAESEAFCKSLGIPLHTLQYIPLEVAGFSDNPPDRCYLCKRELFRSIQNFADENNLYYVAEGSNTDDIGDYRPGMRAIAELGIVSPLKNAGLSKNDIRTLSAYFGLPAADKPSSACLASRFAYGEKITNEGLNRVEKAEELLHKSGFHQLRVRVHGDIARIEVPQKDIVRLLDVSADGKLITSLKSLGFLYITVDLQGYRTGSMNEALN